MISSNMKLRIQDQQLVVTAGDEVHIPLEDINCILIENQFGHIICLSVTESCG